MPEETRWERAVSKKVKFRDLVILLLAIIITMFALAKAGPKWSGIMVGVLILGIGAFIIYLIISLKKELEPISVVKENVVKEIFRAFPEMKGKIEDKFGNVTWMTFEHDTLFEFEKMGNPTSSWIAAYRNGHLADFYPGKLKEIARQREESRIYGAIVAKAKVEERHKEMLIAKGVIPPEEA